MDVVQLTLLHCHLLAPRRYDFVHLLICCGYCIPIVQCPFLRRGEFVNCCGQVVHMAALPRIALSSLEKRRVIGAGSFGEVCLSWWEGGQMYVAVKANGVSCMNVTAIDNERKLLELLLQRPHWNILVVYGIVTDAPDGNVRLVMAHCPGGGLDGYLNAARKSAEVRIAGVDSMRLSTLIRDCYLYLSGLNSALVLSSHHSPHCQCCAAAASCDIDHHPATVCGWLAPPAHPGHHPS